MSTLVLASSNAGKAREFASLLGGLGLEVRPQSDFSVPPAPEDAATFVENAITKARHAAVLTGLPALADDSGLAVAALGGEPGVRSARYAGVGGSDRDNVSRLLERMAHLGGTQRAATFHCVLVLLRTPTDPIPIICQGRWEGHILSQPRGSGGFGYDPVFLVAGTETSAAELPAAEKNRRSHRGQAVAALLAHLRDHGAGLDS